MRITVCVITWRYSDGSGSGIVGVFALQSLAEELMETLREHGDLSKDFTLMSDVPVHGSEID